MLCFLREARLGVPSSFSSRTHAIADTPCLAEALICTSGPKSFFFGAVGLGTGCPVRTQGFLLRSKSDAERRNAAGGQIRSVTEALCAGVSRLSPPTANPCKHYVCKDFCFFIQEAETRFVWSLCGIYAKNARIFFERSAVYGTLLPPPLLRRMFAFINVLTFYRSRAILVSRS